MFCIVQMKKTKHFKQVQSVFLRLFSLRLGLYIQKTHNIIFQENIHEDINPICPTMEEVKIDLSGVLKLLTNLKPDKPARPDFIKPLVLHTICLRFILRYHIM